MEIKINIENKDGSSNDIVLDSIKFQKSAMEELSLIMLS
jgi:hypothetical protein